MVVTERRVPRGIWDRVVDRLWPVTFGVGILMTIGVIAFFALAFWIVFGAAVLKLPCDQMWRWLHE